MTPDARRNFIKKSLTGIAGATMIPAIFNSGLAGKKITMAENELTFRTLGRTGIKVPVISMGTGDTSNPNLVKAAYEAGIKFFGTSSYYGEGNNERMLGGVFKDIPRDSFILATSSMPRGIDHNKGIFTDPGDGARYKKDIEAGLIRLKMDYADIVFLAFAAKRESVFFEPLLRAMEDLKKEGKTRFIGIATHSFCAEALRAAADAKIYDVAMTAYNFREHNNQEMENAIDYAVKAGMGIIAMKTTAGAWWDKDRTQPINTHAALKWVLRNEKISTIMSGMTSFDELQRNTGLSGVNPLDEQEMKDLKIGWKGNLPGLYCHQCAQCVSQCIRHLNIPVLMRSYMYAYGYRNLLKARETIDYSGLPDQPCSGCEKCVVKCTTGFDVRNKIIDIARLKDVPIEFLRT